MLPHILGFLNQLRCSTKCAPITAANALDLHGPVSWRLTQLAHGWAVARLQSCCQDATGLRSNRPVAKGRPAAAWLGLRVTKSWRLGASIAFWLINTLPFEASFPEAAFAPVLGVGLSPEARKLRLRHRDKVGLREAQHGGKRSWAAWVERAQAIVAGLQGAVDQLCFMPHQIRVFRCGTQQRPKAAMVLADCSQTRHASDSRVLSAFRCICRIACLAGPLRRSLVYENN